MFSRIQNLHISQTSEHGIKRLKKFSRIQNLHISQTISLTSVLTRGLVEFKIYISLKLGSLVYPHKRCLVEFKIYISLKPQIEILDNYFDF